MAMGASPGGIFQLVVAQGMRLGAAGIVLGLLAALGLTRWMAAMLVEIRPTDPATFAGIVALFLAIALFAVWLPSRRAARLDPNAALREE
jgi:putative ABC transport system permease protein